MKTHDASLAGEPVTVQAVAMKRKQYAISKDKTVDVPRPIASPEAELIDALRRIVEREVITAWQYRLEIGALVFAHVYGDSLDLYKDQSPVKGLSLRRVADAVGLSPSFLSACVALHLGRGLIPEEKRARIPVTSATLLLRAPEGAREALVTEAATVSTRELARRVSALNRSADKPVQEKPANKVVTIIAAPDDAMHVMSQTLGEVLTSAAAALKPLVTGDDASPTGQDLLKDPAIAQMLYDLLRPIAKAVSALNGYLLNSCAVNTGRN